MRTLAAYIPMNENRLSLANSGKNKKKDWGVGTERIFWSSYTSPRVILYDIL
jgi:hypothetical protein